MHRTIAVIAFAVAAIFFGCAAHADGYVSVKDTPSVGVWRGYVGAYGEGSFAQQSTDIATVGTLANMGDFSIGGGPRVGVDYVSSRWLVGAFADYTFRPTPQTTSLLGLVTASGLGNEWSLGLRGGVFTTAEQNTLIYGLVAYTGAQGKSMTMATLPINFGNDTGIAFGGGIETKLASRVTASLEYRHVDFGSNTATVVAIPMTKAETENLVRVGLNFSLGSGY